MAAWGRGCKAYIVAPNGVRPGASAAGPYTRRGTGILPVMFMARMAMPRLELRLRRFALPALDGHAKAAPNMGPDDEPRRWPKYVRLRAALLRNSTQIVIPVPDGWFVGVNVLT